MVRALGGDVMVERALSNLPGGAAGAVLVTARGAVHAEPHDVRVLNTVGAGDALLAGFLGACADEAALAVGVAWSIAACESPGTRMRPVTDAFLAQHGLTLADIDVIEINEAFAAQYLAVEKELGLDREKVNVNGGAIALGHPLGATGAMILGTVLDELERRDLNTALVTLCIGVGMGTATIIERV